MFIIPLILLWIIAAITISADPKNEPNRWVSLTAFFAGISIFHPIFQDLLIPYLAQHQPGSDSIIHLLKLSATFASVMSYFFVPYCFLRYSLAFSGFQKKKLQKYKNHLGIILLIPIILMYLFFPIGPIGDIPNPGPALRAHSQLWFTYLVIWVIPYILFANFLIIYSFFKSNNPKFRQESLQTFIMVAPPTLIGLSLNYFSAALGYKNLWRFEFWYFLYVFIAFIIFALKDSALGAKIRIEKKSFQNTMRVMSVGTALFNHAIKNEINNINICLFNLENQLKKELPAVESQLKVIENSTSRMFTLVNRIQEHMQTIVLEKMNVNFNDLINKSLVMIQPFLDEKKITLTKDFDQDIELWCDPLHVQEVLYNIFKNATEAMAPGGKLSIEVQQKSKWLVIAISDNGEGIAKEDLPRVVEPFFSTKKHELNYGLGLTYCNNVMQRHDGSLEIYSKKNSGTTVFLNFPIKKPKNIGKTKQYPKQSAISPVIELKNTKA